MGKGRVGYGKSLLNVILMTLMAVLAISALGEEPDKYLLKIYRTDSVPKLDGKMDDACWKDATLVDNFRMFQKPETAPTQKTEIRLCYDAENLYLSWKLYDDNMQKLFYGPPEDMRDILNFSGDIAELFLDPHKTRSQYYQLCATPLATRYDSSTQKSFHFNPDWLVKPGIYENYWTLEVAIPFVSLCHNNEFFGTPQKGDEWGIQFCRDQASLHEWSQWKPTPRSFHQVKLFGTVRFMGKKTGTPLPRFDRAGKDFLYFGNETMKFQVKWMKEKLVGEYLLSHNDEEVSKKTISVNPAGFSIPYHITEGGKWELSVNVSSEGELIYRGYTFSLLPQVTKLLDDIQTNTTMAQKRLKNFTHPIAGELKKKIANLIMKTSSSQQLIKQRDDLNKSQWMNLVKQTKEVGKLWQGLEFDLNLMKLYPQSQKVVKFVVGDAGPDQKIYRKMKFADLSDRPITLAMAGGEYESFQLVIIPFWTELKDVTIRCSDLQGKAGTIPRKDIQPFLVDYVKLKGIDPDDSKMNQYEPDILWPIRKPFQVKKGQLQSVWCDVLMPPGTPAGEYQGEVTISSGGETVKRNLVVRSFGFDLPKVSSLENNFWFSPGYQWKNFYGSFGEKGYSHDIYEKHAKVLSKYRMSCFADDWIHMWNKMKVYREPDGSYTFDFSEWEKFIKTGIKYGSTSLRASLGCNTASLLPFVQPWRKVIDRKTGKTETVAKFVDVKDWWKRLNSGKVSWKDHPIFMAFMKAYIKFLKRMGILETAYWELFDEPNSNPRWLNMIRDHKIYRQEFPELKTMNFGVEPTMKKANKKALGLIDTWAPHMTGIDDKMLAVINHRRKEHGEKFWFYTCGEKRDKDGNVSPFSYYHRSYLGPRIHGWFAWKLQADGMLIFALSGVAKDNIVKEPEKRWPNVEWSDGKSRGCGTIIYPGPNFEMIPGMRLASIRDGLEDYEYFVELKKQAAKLDPQKDQELLAEVIQELVVDDEIIKSYTKWTKDRKLLEKKRERLAALIKKAKTISGKGK